MPNAHANCNKLRVTFSTSSRIDIPTFNDHQDIPQNMCSPFGATAASPRPGNERECSTGEENSSLAAKYGKSNCMYCVERCCAGHGRLLAIPKGQKFAFAWRNVYQ